MKSRITIEVDFENGNTPIIQILRVFPDKFGDEPEDVRDNLIHAFCQSFGHTSSWAKVEFTQNFAPKGVTEFQRIHITPIGPKEMKKEAEVMMKQSGMNVEYPEHASITH